MKTLEKGLIITAIIALGLKSNQLAIGAMVFTSTIGALALLYIYFGFLLFEEKEIQLKDIPFKSILKDRNNKKNRGITIVGYAMSILLLGILFILQGWPSGISMLLVGFIAVLISFIIVAIKNKKQPNILLKNIFLRLSVYGAIGLVLIILNLHLIL